MKKLLFALCSKLIAISAMLFGISGNSQDVEKIYFESWTNNTWQPSMTYEYSYDENLFLINNLTRFYSSGTWTNSSQINYTNNDDGSIHFYISQLWNQQGNNWDNSQKATYSYTETGKPVQVIYQGWSSGAWQNSMNYIYNYDNNDLLIKIDIMIWNTSSLSWQSSARYFYNNNPDSTVHDNLYQTYDAGGGGWSNQNRGTYSYSDSKKLLTTFIEVWINSAWQNSMLLTNEYDENDFLIYNLTQIWSQVAGSWQNNSRIDYENNDDGTVHQYILQNFINTWTNSTRATYTYLPDTGTEEITINAEIQIVPNPTRDFFKYSGKEFYEADISIYEITGKPVKEFINVTSNEILDVNSLNPGFYIVILKFSGRSFSQLLIKNQ